MKYHALAGVVARIAGFATLFTCGFLIPVTAAPWGQGDTYVNGQSNDGPVRLARFACWRISGNPVFCVLAVIWQRNECDSIKWGAASQCCSAPCRQNRRSRCGRSRYAVFPYRFCCLVVF